MESATILPDLVEELDAQVSGEPHKTMRCPQCGGAIPMRRNTGVRFGARYTCPECKTDVELPADEIGQA
jgi:predicted RNA-binding Zn-ribbon protein involved in translation (DUF1610 family)